MRAVHVPSGVRVALKRISVRKTDKGLPENLIRELVSLQALSSSHRNITGMPLPAFADGAALVLPLELCRTDLAAVLRHCVGGALSERLTKLVASSVLAGVSAMHAAGIMHRDLKPGNLLIADDGVVKVADFGMARAHAATGIESAAMSPCVGSRWYRAPEVLYGSRSYSYGLDLWSIGCIIAECISGSPLLPGDTDLEQIRRVHMLLGSPASSEEAQNHGLEATPDYHKVRFAECRGSGVREFIVRARKNLSPSSEDAAVDVLSRLLRYNPEARGEAEEYLHHAWLTSAEPVPDHADEREMSEMIRRMDASGGRTPR